MPYRFQVMRDGIEEKKKEKIELCMFDFVGFEEHKQNSGSSFCNRIAKAFCL